MSFSFTPYAVPLFLAAAMGVGLAWYALRHPPQPEARTFALLSAGLAWWALAYAFTICSTDLDTQYLFNRIKYLGVLSVPPLWILLALQYTRNRPTFSRRFLLLIFLPSILLLPVVLTDHLTHLWWSKVWSGEFEGRPVFQNSHTPLYYLQVLINYGYLLIGSWHYVRFLQQRWEVYRSQAALILIAVIIPFGANIITQLGHSPLPWGLDAFFIALSILILGIAIFRYRFLVITPIARQTVFEHLPDGVIVIDIHGSILDANPAMELLVGSEPGALVGQTLERAIENRDLRETFQEAILARREPANRWDVHLSDRVLTVTATRLPTDLGPEIGTVILLRDITERLQVQAELEASYRQAELERQRLAMTIRTATDAIFLLDPQGRVLASNPAATRLVQAEHTTEFPFPVRELLAQAQEEARIVQREVEVAEMVFHATVAPLQIQDPEDTAGLVLTMHDITHFKHLAELKDDFVSTVSHDLRAPLTSILGFAQIAQRDAPSESPFLESVEQIERAADRMANLITDLLNLASMQAGMKQDTTPVNLSSLARSLVDEQRGAALAKDLEINLELDSQAWVKGDLRLLTQLWSNLIGNAIKYTNQGSITVRTRRIKQTVEGSIIDTGVGISQSEMPYIFDKFYRSQHPQIQELPGDGLGLAFCHLIVQQHKGQIRAESELGAGSTFTFSIPRLLDAPEPQADF